MVKTFKEFLKNEEMNEIWSFNKSNSPLKELESKVYSLINAYRNMLIDSSRHGGEKDDDIHHDIISKNEDHKGVLLSIAKLFSKVHEIEKDSPNLKPSFFSDTAFERIARYAKSKLGYHADEIGEYLKTIDPVSLDHLYNIWRPGSWLSPA